MPYSAPQFGILTTGFVKKLVSDVELDLTTKLRGSVDPNLDLSASEPMGQIMSTFAAEIAEVWEILEVLYNSNDPGAAEDFLLDLICSITGTKRNGATPSLVVCTANVNASTTIPVNQIASVTGQPTNQWKFLGLGSSITNYTPGTATSLSAGNHDTVWASVNTGPIVANAGTLTVLSSPPVGFNSLTNPADATLGTNEESDTPLRIRRQSELSSAGNGTVDKIRASLLEVDHVQQAFVYENTSDFADAFGRPPHSIEAVVFDGTTPLASDDEIAQALWNDKPAGIPYYSATGDSGIATDSQGVDHVVPFSRVSVVNVWLTYTIQTGVDWDGVTGPAAVKTAAEQYANANLDIGSTINALELRALPLGPLSAYAVKGVKDVTALALDFSASPVNTANLILTSRQYPLVVSSHVVVNTV